ncbi:NAD-dependent epimerase/dehydratase family protein [Sphingomonas trueperi]|uniref:NAD-dependent epimerase/dehydratase family protein n=1 Tax=Sphingomonas trueperi TaxID=53317 RepID=UPI000EB5944E
MAERVLITGGGGFIGSRLAIAHAREGDDVHVLVRPRGLLDERRLSPGIDVVRVHLDDLDALCDCLLKIRPSIIYHLASGTGRDPDQRNIARPKRLTEDLSNFLNLLTAANEARPRVLVRTGSLAEYGRGAAPSCEWQREQPLADYTTAMVAATHYAAALQPRLPFRIATARLGLTYGVGQDNSFFLPWILQRCLDGRESLVRHPHWRRDLVHVDDVVAGLRALARCEIEGGAVVNLCTGEAPSMREVAELVVELTGARADLINFGDPAKEAFGNPILWGSPEVAFAKLGWVAKIGLREGLAGMIAAMTQRVPA